MSIISDKWLHNIAAEVLRLPPLNPVVSGMLISVVELHIKKIIQEAHKFQRHGKSKLLSVEDINSALFMNKIEPVYGLSMHNAAQLESITDMGGNSSKTMNKQTSRLVNLVEYGKKATLPPCPLKPEVALHWLAVNGCQPQIADNPSVISSDSAAQPVSLSKELQTLYSRITGIILASESTAGLSAALQVLRTDTGIQELVPFFSKFFYQQIKLNTKRLSLLLNVIKAIKSLLSNSSISLEFHLQQLLPAVFTCVVAAKLSNLPSEDHWTLRLLAADLIADFSVRFSTQFPDLHPRVCKTYLDAIEADKSLSTMFGGLAGLSSMGTNVIRTLLLPAVKSIYKRITDVARSTVDGKGPVANSASKSVGDYHDDDEDEDVMVASKIAGSASSTKRRRLNPGDSALVKREADMCKYLLLKAIGKYMIYVTKLFEFEMSQRQRVRPQNNVRRSNPEMNATRNLTDNAPRRELSNPLVCDFEESLIPYYVSASRWDYYSRLTI